MYLVQTKGQCAAQHSGTSSWSTLGALGRSTRAEHSGGALGRSTRAEHSGGCVGEPGVWPGEPHSAPKGHPRESEKVVSK